MQDYSIDKQRVRVSWDNLSFEYDGNSHAPTATATSADGRQVQVRVTGEQTNAGTYTATATTSDSNYELTNNTVQFTITEEEKDEE